MNEPYAKLRKYFFNVQRENIEPLIYTFKSTVIQSKSEQYRK